MSRYRLSVALLPLVLVLALAPAAALADGTGDDITCPEGDGWVKIEQSSGSISDEWGTLSWSGSTATVAVEADWTLELCLKGGRGPGGGTGPPTPEEMLSFGTFSGEEGALSTQHGDISHLAYRVTGTPPPPPPTVDVTLEKVWLDEDGAELTGPDFVPPAGWGLTLTVAGEQRAALPGNPTASLEVGTGYAVAETLPDGWETVACGGYAEGAMHTGVGEGFTVSEDGGTHVVCNQREAEEPPATGTLVLAKAVDGPEPADTTYGFVVSCDGYDVAPNDAPVLADGDEVVIADDLPDGTSCTITEVDDGGADATSGTVTVGDDAPAAFDGHEASVVVRGDATATIVFENAFEDVVVLPTGFIAVEKALGGEGAPADDAEFVVTVSCEGIDLGDAGTLVFGPGGGEEELGVAIPEDTECTVTEVEAGGADATYVVVNPDTDEVGEEGASATVAIDAEAVTTVRLTNFFDAGEPPPNGDNGDDDNGDDDNGDVDDDDKDKDKDRDRDKGEKPRSRDKDRDGTPTPTRIDAGAGGAADRPVSVALLALLLGTLSGAVALYARRRRPA